MTPLSLTPQYQCKSKYVCKIDTICENTLEYNPKNPYTSNTSALPTKKNSRCEHEDSFKLLNNNLIRTD